MGDSYKIHRGFLLIAILLSMSIALSFQMSCCSSSKCNCNCDSENQCDCCTDNPKKCTQDQPNCCKQPSPCKQNCCTENKANCCTHNCCTQNKEANCCSQNQTNCSNPIAPQPIAPNVNIVNVDNETFEAELSINNNVSIVNSIHIPINISNINDVKVIIESESIIESKENESIVKERIRERYNNTNVVIERIPVPIPVPIEKKIYVPFPLPITYPPPRLPSSCCYSMNPTTIHLNQPMQQICGQQCTSPYMYLPQNPCTNGCRRLNYCLYRNCGSIGCNLAFQDCNLCGNDFYTNYDSFARCSGCFVR